nr:MAG: ORF1 [TTV-like mini virus]
MPYYWKTYYNRRRRFWPWRTRKTFRRRQRWRRYRRRRNYNRRYWVRRRRHKKLTKINVREYQPASIRKCNIIGDMCLFQGSPERLCFNYTQYMHSFVPDYEPGGGGYCVVVESLSSLWEDFQKLRNTWTTSNAGLPLVRYLGCTFTFFQSQYTDYCVEIDTCYPMKDFQYTHADISPSRILQKRKIIRVPSLETRKKRKPYKKVRVKPPSQLQTKWYFQKDICSFPLVMIKATAVDFRYPFGAPQWQSNNITLTCLNPQLFYRHDFSQFSATTGYFPRPSTYLYAYHSTQHPPPQTITTTTSTKLIYLGNTKQYTTGTEKTLTELKTSKVTDWGNPFHDHYLSGDETAIYTADVPPSQIEADGTNKTTFTLLAQPLLLKYRYNPEKDTGQNNKIYLIPNFHDYGWDAPAQPNIVFEGFPLYNLLFGYTDWQEKVHEVQNIFNSYILVINTDFINEKQAHVIPFDNFFLTGHSPYRDDYQEQQIPPRSDYDEQNWYPKLRFQTKTINTICQTAPGAFRSHYKNYVQAKMHYNFHFKWGGCPKTLEKPYDPCSQPDWNIPRNFTSGLQIQNPAQAPETVLQKFDWRRDYVKQTAIKRIQEHTPITETLQLSTDSQRNVPAGHRTPQTETSSESETSEEETETPIQTQILKLKLQQHKLKQRLLYRLKHQNIE